MQKLTAHLSQKSVKEMSSVFNVVSRKENMYREILNQALSKKAALQISSMSSLNYTQLQEEEKVAHA